MSFFLTCDKDRYMGRFFVVFLLLNSLCFAVAPDDAFKQLMDGNNRFVTGKCNHSDRCSERALEATQTHEPYAVIVACSDARVSPELIFDQGIGEVFIVRVAGNVVGPLEINSIDYAVLVLKAPLILVIGHQNCGAVQAVLSKNTKGIEAIAALIQPAVKASQQLPGNPLENAIKTNATMVADKLRGRPAFAKLIQDNKLAIKEGYYHFDTGAVEILKD